MGKKVGVCLFNAHTDGPAITAIWNFECDTLEKLF